MAQSIQLQGIRFKQGETIAQFNARVEAGYGFSISVLLERARLGLEVPSELPLAWIKARDKSTHEILSIPCYEDVPPQYYPMLRYCNAHIWDWYEIIPSAQKQVIAQHSDAGPEHRGDGMLEIKRRKRNRVHEKLYIYLHEEQTVTCEETGISFKCALPAPASLNLAYVHPLAHFQNVQDVMKAYKRSGIRLEQELEAQVLAGMLLTMLRNRNLLLCKDAPKANLFLSAASKDILAYAVRWFYSRTSTIGFPALSLYLEDTQRIAEVQQGIKHLSPQQIASQNAETFIIKYMQACRGESVLDEAAHIKLAPSKEQRKVKIYTDNLVQQHKAAERKGKDGNALLGRLVSAYPGQYSLLFTSIKTNLKGLAFLSEKFRMQVASKLRDTFPANSDAIELAEIFAHVEQNAIEDDLESFTQSIKKDVTEFKRMKVDFMSKIKKVS